MSELNAEISAAIDGLDVDRARNLLRDALKDANADTYYLASLVALNETQRQDFLQKAVALDPFHAKAQAELDAKLASLPQSEPLRGGTPASTSLNADTPNMSRSVNPPSGAASASTPITSSAASSNNWLGIAAITGLGIGIIVMFDWLIGLPFQTGSGLTGLDWITTPLAAILAGFVLATLIARQGFVLNQQEKSTLMIGWAVAWLISLILGATIYSELTGTGRLVIFVAVEALVASLAIAYALKRFATNLISPIFWAWIAAYGVFFLIHLVWPDLNRTIYPSDVALVVTPQIVADVAWYVVGCYLTLNYLQKAQPKSA